MDSKITESLAALHFAPSLPYEILRKILLIAYPALPLSAPSSTMMKRYAAYKRSCLISRAWRPVCQDFLFAEIAIFNLKRIDIVCRALQRAGKGMQEGVKSLRVGDTRKEKKQSCTGDDWHRLLDLMPKVQQISVCGVWISNRGESEVLLRWIGLDELVRPSVQRLCLRKMALRRKQLPVAFPKVAHLSITDCEPFAQASHLPHESPYQEIYRIFPRMRALFIQWDGFVGRPDHERKDKSTPLTAFASNASGALWPADQPLKILQLRCPPVFERQRPPPGFDTWWEPGNPFSRPPPFVNPYDTVPALPKSLEIIRITSVPGWGGYDSNRFIWFIEKSLKDLPKLKYLYLPECYLGSGSTRNGDGSLERKCEERGIKCVFVKGLEEGVEGYEVTEKLFWKDVSKLEGKKVMV